MTIIKDELAQIRDAFATPRRTQIIDWEADVDDEDLIQREDMVVTVSHAGYIKRVPLSTYRAQRRGGKGRAGMVDARRGFRHAPLRRQHAYAGDLFFSSQGQAYKEKVWRLPLAAPNAKGKALVNMLPLEKDERITTIMPLPEDEASWDKLDVMFATSRGTVRRNKLSDFIQVNRGGKIAMKLDEGEAIVDVQICTENDDVLLTTAKGQCIRFAVPEVRVFKGRDSMGVRGINLAKGDDIISMAILRHVEATGDERAGYLKMRRAVIGEADERRGCAPTGDAGDEETVDRRGRCRMERYTEMSAHEQFILTVSEKGYGKRTSSYEYRITGRGGKGITAMAVNNRNGKLVASFPVENSDQIMLVTDKAASSSACRSTAFASSAATRRASRSSRPRDGENASSRSSISRARMRRRARAPKRWTMPRTVTKTRAIRTAPRRTSIGQSQSRAIQAHLLRPRFARVQLSRWPTGRVCRSRRSLCDYEALQLSLRRPSCGVMTGRGNSRNARPSRGGEDDGGDSKNHEEADGHRRTPGGGALRLMRHSGPFSDDAP